MRSSFRSISSRRRRIRARLSVAEATRGRDGGLRQWLAGLWRDQLGFARRCACVFTCVRFTVGEAAQHHVSAVLEYFPIPTAITVGHYPELNFVARHGPPP